MKLYYSGLSGYTTCDREDPFAFGLNVMLTAYQYIGKEERPDWRLVKILEARNRGITKPEHFLDSGAFSLWSEALKASRRRRQPVLSYYDSDAYWKYVDQYADLVRRYQLAIDYYANVDVIGSAPLTRKAQDYLEKEHGLKPVPVFHAGEDFSHLYHYIDSGYEIIGVGSLVWRTKRERVSCFQRCFEAICDPKTKLPRVKIHAFGVGSPSFLIRYPIWSADSSGWLVRAVNGVIMVPKKRGGKFVFDGDYHTFKVTKDPSSCNPTYYSSVLKVKDFIGEWLTYLGLPLGDQWGEDNIGRVLRSRANLLFFEKLCSVVPQWPWPYEKHVPSFELTP